MEWLDPVSQALLCGAVLGFLIHYSGVGGGVLVLPALTVLFGLPTSVAVGTASLYAAATKVVSGARHWRSGNVNGRLCLKFSVAAVPGLLISAKAVNYFARDGGDEFQAMLEYLVAAAIALSLVAAQFRGGQTGANRRFALPAAAFAIGLVMGATGVGGGVLIVPALLLLSAESPKRVVGASVVIAVVLSALTAWVYGRGEQIEYALAGWLVIGSLPGIWLGEAVLRRSSEKAVRKTLNVLILVALVAMLWGPN